VKKKNGGLRGKVKIYCRGHADSRTSDAGIHCTLNVPFALTRFSEDKQEGDEKLISE
jgi:hypothetical protein